MPLFTGPATDGLEDDVTDAVTGDVLGLGEGEGGSGGRKVEKVERTAAPVAEEVATVVLHCLPQARLP